MKKEEIKQVLRNQISLWRMALSIIEQAEKDSPIPPFEEVHNPIGLLERALSELDDNAITT